MIDNKNDKNKAFRPSAVPLVTVDPYFSIWSMCDKLNDGERVIGQEEEIL